MKTMCRGLFAVCIALVACGPAGAADPYPARPIRVLVPFAAGSGTDVNTRQVTDGMTRHLPNATFVVDNRPGANGFMAAAAAARAAPDGYTLFVSTNTTHAANPHLFKQLPYAPLTDFVAIGMIARGAPILLRGESVKVQTVAELLALAKGRPDGFTFGTTNASGELATKLFARATGIKALMVPYKGTPQALTDLAAGQIDFVFGDVASARGMLRSGKLKALAVASPRRLAAQPQVPTMAEEHVSDVEVQIWLGIFAPKGTPGDVVTLLNDALDRALGDADVGDALLATGVEPMPTTPQAASAFATAQYDVWGNLVKTLGIEPQ